MVWLPQLWPVKAVVAVEMMIVVQKRRAPTTSPPPIRNNVSKNKIYEPKKEITMELTNYKHHRHKEKYMNAFKNYIIYKSILGK